MNKLWEYNGLDCVTTASVYQDLLLEMDELGVSEFYWRIPHPLLHAVMRMQERGMWCDQEVLRAKRAEYDHRIHQLTSIVRQLAENPTLNPNSGDEIRKLLYVQLKLPIPHYTKVGHKPSVDELALKKLLVKYPNPLFMAITKYRQAAKLRATYLEPRVDFDGRIRSRFLVHGTATGRLSSREPNFQNIPKDQGNNLRPIYGAPPGRVLISCDASQLELRLIALASGCRAWLDAFESGADVHMVNAQAIYGKPREYITHEERTFAKRFIFCQNYGGGPEKISAILLTDADIVKSPSECALVLQTLRQHVPEIYAWRERVLAETRKTGVITNEFGRKRVTFVQKSDLAGVAYNTPIQSTAADYINSAFIRMHNRGVALVNQVHDEVLAECAEDDVERVAAIMQEELRQPVTLWGQTVVLPADCTVGTHWGELTTWPPPLQ